MQKIESRRISDLARVAWDTPCGKIEAEHFSHALNININAFEIHHTFEDVLYYTDLKPDRLYEVDLLYNSVTKHYDCITNINGVLQSIRNQHRVFCRKCRRIKYNTQHRCYGVNDKDRQVYVVNGESMFHNYDCYLSKEDTDFLKDGYI